MSCDETSEVTLEVKVTGKPRPDIKWYHNDQEVAEDEHRKLEYDEAVSF